MKEQVARWLGIGLLAVPLPVFFLFLSIEERLRETGSLNTRDLQLIGNETGTLRDYLTNVWYWDALGVMLLALVPAGFTVGLWLL